MHQCIELMKEHRTSAVGGVGSDEKRRLKENRERIEKPLFISVVTNSSALYNRDLRMF